MNTAMLPDGTTVTPWQRVAVRRDPKAPRWAKEAAAYGYNINFNEIVARGHIHKIENQPETGPVIAVTGMDHPDDDVEFWFFKFDLTTGRNYKGYDSSSLGSYMLVGVDET